MNKENMQKVLDYIITHPQEFRMAGWGSFNSHNQCLTSACICGTANYLDGEFNLGNCHNAANFLGLSTSDSERLFLTTCSVWQKYHLHLDLPYNLDLTNVKQEHAVTMLTNLISGEWNFDGINFPEGVVPVPL